MPILSQCCFICSIDAARNVSAAAKTHEMPFLLRKSAIFAIVVVFPVPLIPANKITKGSFSLLLDFSFILSKIIKIRISEEEYDVYAEDLQMLLLENNVAYEVTEKVISELKAKIVGKELLRKEVESEIKDSLKEVIEDILIEPFDIL